MTPLRSIRIDADLWQLALQKARNEGTTVTRVVINALRYYVENQKAQNPALTQQMQGFGSYPKSK